MKKNRGRSVWGKNGLINLFLTFVLLFGLSPAVNDYPLAHAETEDISGNEENSTNQVVADEDNTGEIVFGDPESVDNEDSSGSDELNESTDQGIVDEQGVLGDQDHLDDQNALSEEDGSEVQENVANTETAENAADETAEVEIESDSETEESAPPALKQKSLPGNLGSEGSAPPIMMFGAGSPGTMQDPELVWHEGFEPNTNYPGVANPSPNYSTDRGSVTRYIGADPNNSTPVLGSTWGSIQNCVGVRISYENEMPERSHGPVAPPLLGSGTLTGDGYCEQIARVAVKPFLQDRYYDDSGRESWWNIGRMYAKSLGGGSESNTIASFVTYADITQTNIGTVNQTPVYQTKTSRPNGTMDFVALDPDNWADITTGRFYSGSIDVASTNQTGSKPAISMRLFSTVNSGVPNPDGVDLWPTGQRIDPTSGTAYTTGQPTPWPSGNAVRVGSYSSNKSALFTKAQAENFIVKVTNDNGSRADNDFGIDNLRVFDVTPQLHKGFTSGHVPFPNTAEMVFTITNTSEKGVKAGWGFTEKLPEGLTVASPNVQSTCGADFSITNNTDTITVTNKTIPAGAESCTLKVRVKVDPDPPYGTGVYTFTGLEDPNADPQEPADGFTSSLTGLNAPGGIQVEFYSFTPKKEAFLVEGGTVASEPLDHGAAVDPGSIIEYKLTFDNSENSNPAVIGADDTVTGWVAKPVIDYLHDILDDADLLNSAGNIDNGNPHAEYSGWAGTPAQPTVIYSQADKKATITGTVLANTVGTMKFRVKVKDNLDGDPLVRQGTKAATTTSPAVTGYQLNNYLLTADESPLTATACEDETDTCTKNTIRAWTVEKKSQPIDGASVHVGANNYFRVNVRNYSGEKLEGVKLEDDMTSALFAGIMDLGAPQAVTVPWGISFYDQDGVHLNQHNIIWDGVNGLPSSTGDTNPTLVFAGDTTYNTNFPNASLPTFEAGIPFNGTWTLNIPAFDIPADAALAVVGYAIKIGFIADPVDNKGYERFKDQDDLVVPAEPNAFWVNTVMADTATFAGQPTPKTDFEPNRCRLTDNIPPGWDNVVNGIDSNDFEDCKTYHVLEENFFHLWKQGSDVISEQNPAGNNLQETHFVMSDTLADAENGVPSRWLCHADNHPGTYMAPNPSYAAPGSKDPATVLETEWDYGENSAVYAAILAWNTGLDLWNANNPDDELEEAPICGTFFIHTDSEDGQPIGSWHARDIQGGFTGTPASGGTAGPHNWREAWSDPVLTENNYNNGTNDSAGILGTYWVTERKAPEGGYELLAKPFKLWVAPSTPTPGELHPIGGVFPWDWYNYQGRLSMPVVGEGEPAADSSWGNADPAGIGTTIRSQCVSPWVLPENSQPNCVMPTGWTMPIFDAKLPPLPLAGGAKLGWVPFAGATVFILAAFSVLALRRSKYRIVSVTLKEKK